MCWEHILRGFLPLLWGKAEDTWLSSQKRRPGGNLLALFPLLPKEGKCRGKCQSLDLVTNARTCGNGTKLCRTSFKLGYFWVFKSETLKMYIMLSIYACLIQQHREWSLPHLDSALLLPPVYMKIYFPCFTNLSEWRGHRCIFFFKTFFRIYLPNSPSCQFMAKQTDLVNRNCVVDFWCFGD